ncbi:MAG TPA: sugar kinase [Chthoniobacter sp.]|jgi:2-dehydro-3-deoxygluconokinase
MPDVVTFGEIMLRLSPPGHLRLLQTPSFEITFGGAEANVAVMIAQLGGNASYVTRLPANDLGQRAINELRGLGVDTSGIVRGGDRMGVYFLEQGASQRPGRIIYDRARSAIAEADPAEFNWEKIFAGAKWFHWSGITPALSASAVKLMDVALASARRAGLAVSFDVNYRSRLWSSPEAAGTTLAPLMKGVHLCVTSIEEAQSVLGVQVPGDSGPRAAETAMRLCERYGFEVVALTQRQGTTAHATSWAAMLFHEGEPYFSSRHEIAVVDRVGAGDSFSGALIFALLRGDPPQRAIDFAVAASTLKHTIPGDYNVVSLAEVEALAGGAGGGRVQR